MKNALFLLIGILVVSADAEAQQQDAMQDQSIRNCVGVLQGDETMTDAERQYSCENPYLDHRDSDSKEQEAIRQKLAREQAEAKENMPRPYLENDSIDDGLFSNPDSLSDGHASRNNN